MHRQFRYDFIISMFIDIKRRTITCKNKNYYYMLKLQQVWELRHIGRGRVRLKLPILANLATLHQAYKTVTMSENFGSTKSNLVCLMNLPLNIF